MRTFRSKILFATWTNSDKSSTPSKFWSYVTNKLSTSSSTTPFSKYRAVSLFFPRSDLFSKTGVITTRSTTTARTAKKTETRTNFQPEVAGFFELFSFILEASKWQMTEWHLSVQFERKKGLISVLTIRLHMPAEILQNHAECIMSNLHKTASETARLSLLW